MRGNPRFVNWVIWNPKDTTTVNVSGYHWNGDKAYGLVRKWTVLPNAVYRITIVKRLEEGNTWAQPSCYKNCKCYTGTVQKLSKALNRYMNGGIYSDIDVLFEVLVKVFRVDYPDLCFLIEEERVQYVKSTMRYIWFKD